MQINNENVKYSYILHFKFHISYKYSTYRIFVDTCNEKYQKNISTCEETRDMIHDYSSRKIYLNIYI